MKRLLSLVLAGTGLLLAAALGCYFLFLRPSSPLPPPEDPRLGYSGPFRNVRPDVRFVPDERCVECHREIASSYAQHPMGRSLRRAAQAEALPEDAGHNNPFEALGSRFLVDSQEGRTWHRRMRPGPAGRPATALEWEVQYVLGSGTRGHSYLASRDGYLVQTPISWYTQKEKWDLSPGFGAPLLTGRAVVPECLYCHANRAVPEEGFVNRYAPGGFDGHAIGCQRCHGPGELHVGGRERSEPVAGDLDSTIVNPRHLEVALRNAVCEQCHLTGARILHRGRSLDEFRPGLPMQAFWSVFPRTAESGEGQKAVSHVEQMYQSRCFLGGARRLGCVSCHNPHERVLPAQRVAYYRGRCLQCHEGPGVKGCGVPEVERGRRPEGDSCIDCHMPRRGSTDIPHTASTDHRILREGKSADGRAAEPASGDGLSLVSFYAGGKETTEEDERDRALVVVKLALEGEARASRALARALPVLEAAARRAPDDLPAGEARGKALGLQGREAEGLAAFEAVLAKAPNREEALVGAASMAEALGRMPQAQSYWRRAVAADPWVPEYHRRLVLQLVKQEAWQEAESECAAWGRVDPFSTEARIARVDCLLALGNKEAARTEFARLEALAPANLRELQIRFEKKLK